MKPSTLLISLALFLALVSPALATSLSFEDGSAAGPADFNILALYPNGTSGVIGLYNTSSSSINLDPNNSYVLRLTPSRIDYVKNPSLIIQDGSSYITSQNLVALIIIIIAGLLFVTRRR
jgi:hypothetical protein